MKKSLFCILSIIFVLFSLFEFIFLWALPKQLNLNEYTPEIIKLVKSQTNIDAQIGNVTFDTFSDFSINFKLDSIKLNTKNEELLYAKNLNLRLNLLPLILKHIDIKTFSADMLKVSIERNKNGKYNINNIIISEEKAGIEFKLSHARLDLENYEINYKDNFYNNKYKLKGDYFIINKFNPEKCIDMYILGDLDVNNNTPIPLKFNIKTKLPLQKYIDDKNLKLDILVPTFDLSILSDYIKEYSDKTLTQLSGKTSINIKSVQELSNNSIDIFILSNDTKYLRKDNNMSVISNGKYSITSKLKAENNKLDIQNLHIKGREVDVNVNGITKDFDSLKKIKNDLHVKIQNTRSDTLYWLIPSELPTEFDSIRKAKKYGFYGDINTEINIKGKGETPNITGPLKLTKVYIQKPFAPHVPKATIDIDFKGQYLHLNSHTNSDINEYVNVLGNIELYGDENADLHIYSTKNINLLYTYQVLIPLHDTLGFDLGPLPIMSFYDGMGNIDLYVKGNYDYATLDGYFQCFNTIVSMNGINAKLSRAKARLDFAHTTYHFETSQAFQNTSPIKIIGNGDVLGKFDFNVLSEYFEAKDGLKILKTSEMFSDFKYLSELIDNAWGKVSFKVNIKGKLDTLDIEKIKNLIKYSATVKYKNINAANVSHKLTFTNVSGITEIANDKFNFDLKGLINNNKFSIKTNSNMKHINIDAFAENFNIQTFIPQDKNIKINIPPIATKADIKLKYSGELNKIDIKDININAKFKNIANSNISNIKINDGLIDIHKGKTEIKNIYVKCFASNIVLNGKIKNIFAKSKDIDIHSDIKKLDLYDINRLMTYFPLEKQNEINLFLNRISGNVTGEITYTKNKLNGYLDANSIILHPKKLEQSIVIGNTRIDVKNNNAEIRPFTFHFYQMPVFVKLTINSILNNPKINLYATTKITPAFLDSFLNNYLSYPLKLTGEGTLTTTLQGNINDLETYVSLTIPSQSDISYLGVNLGDIYDNKELFLHAKIKPNSINIKKFDYKKYIKTQNGRLKPLPIIGVMGTINKNNNKYTFDPIVIKTTSPASAKFFNMIFKKSVIKNGLFDCNLKLSGDVYNPKILGRFSASNIYMPTYNTNINDLLADFNSSIVDLRIRANAYNSEVEVNSIIKNSVQPSIEIKNINVIAKYVNIDVLTKELTKITYSEYNKNSNQSNINSLINNVSKMNIIIHKGTLNAKNIFLQGIMAKNLELDFSLNKNLLLTIDKIFFGADNGSVKGKVTYNFKNTNLIANLSAKNVNAKNMAKALFLIDDQIDGLLNGTINIKTSGIDQEQQIKNLNGNVEFQITDGKMPKLGSLEYLLRASNLLESGITGVSINSILQLVIPMHTGNFNSLQGSFSLTNGVANNIHIYTIGKSLNLYLFGTLDLTTAIAHIDVWGKLDKDIKTPLGLLGNASLNSVFDVLIPWVNLSDPQNAGLIKNINKIPGLELSTQKNRIFRAIINGDIETENFVEKFEWIKN